MLYEETAPVEFQLYTAHDFSRSNWNRRAYTRHAFDSRMTLTFDLLTSGLTHADRLPWAVCFYEV